MGNAVFRGWQLRNPLTDFYEIWHSWLCRRPHSTCKCRGKSVPRGRVCACVNLSPSGVYFFAYLFLGPMRIATGRLTAQTTRPVGIHIHFMVWIIKTNISPIFTTKSEKIALRPTATSKSYNSGTFQDTCTLFAPNWGFSGSGNLMVSFKFNLTDPFCHGNQPPLFEHKIGNNSDVCCHLPGQPLLPW